VTFDVGATLIAPHPSVGHIYSEVAASGGYPGLIPEELNRRFAAAWAALRNFEHSYREWATLVDATFAGLTRTPPSRTFFPELYERFSASEAWAIFPDVCPTLETLAGKGLRLGIISNWDARLKPLLERLGLERYFEAIVVSCEVGCSKPGALIFETSSRLLGEPPGAILHVGDNRVMDLEGARAAGFQSVLIDRRDGASSADRVRSLVELPAMVD